MNDATILLASIIGLFILTLIVKEASRKTFCVLCVSVSLTWIAFLAMYWFGKFNEPVALGVLMGESVFGVYHLLEKHTKEDLHVFRLPFLLTLTAVAFSVLGVRVRSVEVALILGVLWAAGAVLYAGRKSAKLGALFKRIVACCKNW